MVSKRKPISINRKNNNISSLNNEEQKQYKNNQEFFSNNQNIEKKIRLPNGIRRTNKTNGFIKNTADKVSNAVSGIATNSNDTGIQTTYSILKITKTGIVLNYKGTKKVFKTIRVAPRKTSNAIKSIKAMPNRIKTTVKAIPNTIKSMPRRTITSIKRGSANVVKAIPTKTFSAVKLAPKGINKGLNVASNTLKNSDDIGVKSTGHMLKLTQNSFKLVKDTFKLIIYSLKMPLISLIIFICTFFILIFGVLGAILEFFNLETGEQLTATEIAVLSQRKSISHDKFQDDLEDTIFNNTANPLNPFGNYHVFYFVTQSGNYIPISSANTDFLSEDTINEIIRPILHLIVMMDFELDFYNLTDIIDVDLYLENNFSEAFIRGARVDIYEKIAYSLDKIYGEGRWKKEIISFRGYVETIYDFIFDTFAEITTQELSTEWCAIGVDDETEQSYADIDCPNCSNLLKHDDNIALGLNSCDYYYYICKGTHKVLVCSKTNHTHGQTCVQCGIEEHTHGQSCVQCGIEEHTHKSSCLKSYNGSYTLICGMENHTHKQSCMKCGIEEHTHGQTCVQCGIEEHTHGQSCYKDQYHDGQLSTDCGNAKMHRGCNGYKICQGHRVLGIGFDYASLEELEERYIYARYEEIVGLDPQEAKRLKDYIELYFGLKNDN